VGLKHLSDETIQDYIDGNFESSCSSIEEHVAKCPLCRSRLEQYQVIVDNVINDDSIELSPSFVEDVAQRVGLGDPESELERLLPNIVAGAAIMAAFAAVLMFIDISSIMTFILNINPFDGIVTSEKLSAVSTYLTANRGWVFTAVSGILAVASIWVVDRQFARTKGRSTNLMSF